MLNNINGFTTGPKSVYRFPVVHHKNRNLFISASLLLLLVVGFCTYRYFNRTPVLRIAVIEWAGAAPVVYAQVLGLYEKYNVPVEIIYSSNPNQSYEHLKADRVEGVFAVLTDLILMRSVGFGVKAAFFTDYSEEGDSIISQPEIKDIKSLKGKTIGIDGFNTFSHVFVLKTLEKHGLREKDVYFKVVSFEKALEALQKNEVAAVHTWDPTLREALILGYRRIATAKEIPGVILDCFAFKDEILSQYPDLVRRFTKIFFEAQAKMLENPFQAAEDMKYFFKNDPDAFAHSFKDIHFITPEENHRRMQDHMPDSFSKEALEINLFFLKRGQTNDSDLHHRVIMENHNL